MMMYVTMSVSTGLYPNLDLWTANKLQLQLQLRRLSETDMTPQTMQAQFMHVTTEL
jgi:hypothetical protein